MPRAHKTPNTFDHISLLLARDSKVIMKRENTNENRVHLYGVGEYWAAFNKSAFLLEKLTNEECEAIIVRLKNHPFPVLMSCVHYEKVKELCRQHIMAKKTFEYLQLLTHPIDSQSYAQWYREYLTDEG